MINELGRQIISSELVWLGALYLSPCTKLSLVNNYIQILHSDKIPHSFGLHFT